MKPVDPKQTYGEEYPAAIMCHGIRMTLERENRFIRSYHSDEARTGCVVSRFAEGSASMTALELEQEWDKWTDDMRTDFCQSVYPRLFEQPDFPRMLRFILEHGERHVGEIALSVAYVLPQEEAFDALVRALRTASIERAANIIQGIAATKHHNAKTALRSHLASLWQDPTLWDNTGSSNPVAFGAIACIAHLIRLGEPPSDFTAQARKLSEHSCPRTRRACRTYLSKHYTWLAPE